MDRRLAHGIEHFALRRAAEHAEGHGRIGQPERRQPDLGDLLAERFGRDGERVHVRRLALIGRHAGRGVALDVLDRAHALARRELDVARGDVVLEIDERLGQLLLRPAARRGRTCRRDRDRAPSTLRRCPGVAPAAPPAPRAVRERLPRDRTRRRRRRRSLACAGAPGRNVRVAASNASLPRDCENRCTLGVQPPLMAMRSQAIVVGLARPPVRPQPRDQRMRDAQAAARAEDRRMRLDRQPARARRLGQRPVRLGARYRRSWRSRSRRRRDRARRDSRRRAWSRRRLALPGFTP